MPPIGEADGLPTNYVSAEEMDLPRNWANFRLTVFERANIRAKLH